MGLEPKTATVTGSDPIQCAGVIFSAFCGLRGCQIAASIFKSETALFECSIVLFPFRRFVFLCASDAAELEPLKAKLCRYTQNAEGGIYIYEYACFDVCRASRRQWGLLIR